MAKAVSMVEIQNTSLFEAVAKQPTVDGWVKSINSTKALFDMYKTMYTISSVLTSQLRPMRTVESVLPKVIAARRKQDQDEN